MVRGRSTNEAVSRLPPLCHLNRQVERNLHDDIYIDRRTIPRGGPELPGSDVLHDGFVDGRGDRSENGDVVYLSVLTDNGSDLQPAFGALLRLRLHRFEFSEGDRRP